MKNLFYLLGIVSFLMLSCSKDNTKPAGGGGVKVSVDQTPINFTSEGGTRTIVVTADGDWSISGTKSWCSVSPESGKAGTTNVAITVTKEDLNEDRNATLSIGDKSLSVTQKKTGALILTQDKYDIPMEGKVIDVEVSHNVDFEVIIPFNVRTWIEKVEAKSLTKTQLQFKIAATDEDDKRYGEIIIKDKSSDLVDTIKIYQVQQSALILTSNSQLINNEGGKFIAELKTNIEYEITIPQSETWIKAIVSSKAMRTDRHEFEVDALIGDDNREVEIIFKDKISNLSDTMILCQTASNSLFLMKSVHNVDGNAHIVVVKMTKIDYQANIIEGTDWIEPYRETYKSKASIEKDSVKFFVQVNEIEEPRRGKIVFTDKTTSLTDTVKINQASGIPLAHKKYYVATNGNDTNIGTKASPFSTISRAQQAVSPGDTVYIRGGTYTITEADINASKSVGLWAYINYMDKSGTSAARTCYWAYPGETPVFDMSEVKPVSQRIIVFYVKGSWLHFKGFEIIGTQVTILEHTQSECIRNEGGSNNLYEQISMHDGQAIGYYLTKGSNNLVLNCDAYRNWDYTSEGGRGGNVDGFGCHPTKGGVGNVFRGCRAWFNSDDGYDLIGAFESVIFENCWAMYNGYSSDFKARGDGNGFKAGGYGNRAVSTLPVPIPSHTIKFCIAVQNLASGLYSNHHMAGNKWYNNSSYKNARNYNMLNRLADNVTDVPGYDHILKNNLGFSARSTDTTQINKLACDISFNSFTLPLVITTGDFISLDQSQLELARKADGSLPEITFMKPKATSTLIDKGKDIGFPYLGLAPDLGAL